MNIYCVICELFYKQFFFFSINKNTYIFSRRDVMLEFDFSQM